MMNNWAFAFNISVPVHIILRSFGSVTTMAAGWLRGKKYTPVQIFSVAVLTLGVMVSAWADASAKVSLHQWLTDCLLSVVGQKDGRLKHRSNKRLV